MDVSWEGVPEMGGQSDWRLWTPWCLSGLGGGWRSEGTAGFLYEGDISEEGEGGAKLWRALKVEEQDFITDEMGDWKPLQLLQNGGEWTRTVVLLRVREGRRQLMLYRWKCADRVTLLMWVWKDREPSRTTPWLLTCGEGETEGLSVVRVKLLAFERVDLEPMLRTSVLTLLSFRNLEKNHDLISCGQVQGNKYEKGHKDVLVCFKQSHEWKLVKNRQMI